MAGRVQLRVIQTSSRRTSSTHVVAVATVATSNDVGHYSVIKRRTATRLATFIPVRGGQLCGGKLSKWLANNVGLPQAGTTQINACARLQHTDMHTPRRDGNS